MTLRATLLTSILVLSTAAHAQTCIDTELVLLSDLSGSMNLEEKQIVRNGHVAAFRNGAVLDKILGPERPCGAIAVTYVEWASTQVIVIDWTIIASDEDAETFAVALENAPFSQPGAQTYLSYAMDFAGKLIRSNGIEATDRVVDILGDGEDASPTKPHEIVERYSGPDVPIGERVTFNGLPVIDGPHAENTLVSYFKNKVIGGPWSRVVPARGFEDVPRAIVEKLSKELG